MSARPVGEGYAGDDFYCEVALPNVQELAVEYEDDHILAFHHTRPYWQTHIVVMPKRHVASLTSVGPADADLVRRLLVVVQELARRVEHDEGAASVVTNLGRYQDSKHLHVHIHSGATRNDPW
jgi:histidine triad (HIT) family protein